MSVKATTKDNTIIVSGYFNNGEIVITEKEVKAELSAATSIDEQELNNVIQQLRDQLDANGCDLRIDLSRLHYSANKGLIYKKKHRFRLQKN